MATQDTVSQDALAELGIARRDASRSQRLRVLVGGLIAMALLFWVPEVIIALEWADYWIIFLTEVYIWAMFAVAFNLLMGFTGMISFGQAAYLGIGGYTAGLLLKNIAGLPFAVGLILAPVGGALAALIIGYFCIRRTHIYFAILTLAFGHIVYLIAFKWYDFTGGDNGLIGVPVPEWIKDPTFANYYKFVLVICMIGIYLLWRIVNSPFGRTLMAIRENPERANFVGVNVQMYKLYAFVVAGAFSGLAGALIMVNERSVYPDLAHWTQSAQVLLMSLLGGVYTFTGPIVGAFLLQTMDADITQNYPEIWQLFLGGVLVLILFALPGGIMGYIQDRGTIRADTEEEQLSQSMDVFTRKFWYFFFGVLAFTAFFSILNAPYAWLFNEDWDFELFALITWGIVPRTLLQAVIGGAILYAVFRGIRAYRQSHAWLLLVLVLLPLPLHIYLETPLSGILVIVLWIVFTAYNLLHPQMRTAFRRVGQGEIEYRARPLREAFLPGRRAAPGAGSIRARILRMLR